MILICSDINEGSTDIVCSWLKYFNKEFVRISNKNIITIDEILINDTFCDINFRIDNKPYKFSQFSSYWYRRSNVNFRNLPDFEFFFKDEDLTKQAKYFIKDEYSKVTNFFNKKLAEISKLNNFNDNYLNKLTTLKEASDLGINVPETIISNDFDSSIFKDKKWITKSISDLIMEKKGVRYYSTTKRVNRKDIDNTFLSLIQTEINKKFEIRSFYFNETFYSSVIFSQGNKKTELDFRNYDTKNPNRVVPFKLPTHIENKLIKLCKRLNLKSGSFDIAYTNDNKYVLFEVNPVGQFEQVSFPCNYQIHKKIAEVL